MYGGAVPTLEMTGFFMATYMKMLLEKSGKVKEEEYRFNGFKKNLMPISAGLIAGWMR
jgi:hypothetical protein